MWETKNLLSQVGIINNHLCPVVCNSGGLYEIAACLKLILKVFHSIESLNALFYSRRFLFTFLAVLFGAFLCAQTCPSVSLSFSFDFYWIKLNANTVCIEES